MKQKDAYEYLSREYVSKCICCDGCIAEAWCILNYVKVKRTRHPYEGCDANLREYLRGLQDDRDV
jgi:hypothetical protein